jgi:hypothetical protein
LPEGLQFAELGEQRKRSKGSKKAGTPPAAAQSRLKIVREPKQQALTGPKRGLNFASAATLYGGRRSGLVKMLFTAACGTERGNVKCSKAFTHYAY